MLKGRTRSNRARSTRQSENEEIGGRQTRSISAAITRMVAKEKHGA